MEIIYSTCTLAIFIGIISTGVNQAFWICRKQVDFENHGSHLSRLFSLFQFSSFRLNKLISATPTEKKPKAPGKGV